MLYSRCYDCEMPFSGKVSVNGKSPKNIFIELLKLKKIKLPKTVFGGQGKFVFCKYDCMIL